MSRAQEFRQHVAVWALILLLWCLMVLAFASQLVVTGSVEWQRAISLSLRDWWPWALLTPPVAWLASAFRLERGSLALSVPVHLAACAIAVVMSQLLSPPPEPMGRGPGPGPEGMGIQRRQRLGRPFQGSEHRPPGELPARATPGNVARDIDAVPPQDGPPPPRPTELRHFFAENLLGRRAQINVPIYWIIVSVVHALAYYRRSQEREQRARELESRLTRARLEALRAQLHPHFLFNTLNAISMLVHKNPNAADEMIANLSSLLRAALDTSDQQEIPLRRELELLQPYLEIQETRFGDRLKIRQEVAPDTLDLMVPVLLLQPLVENAIRHGIEPKPGEGMIRIAAQRQGDRLNIVVEDDGMGLNATAPSSSTGIGIPNTRARLEALYQQKAEMQIRPAPTGGCMVQISLPAREAISPQPS